jgi:transposase-like protein
METMERKKPRPRRSFASEFKAAIVKLCQRGDRSIWPTRVELDALSSSTSRVGHARRLHSTLGYLSPAQYKAIHHNADSQAA